MHNKKIHSADSPFSLVDDVLYYHKSSKTAKLSENQSKLLHCLLHGKGGKEDVINFIWGGSDSIKDESKYKKLISRTRSKLTKSGFPKDTILTTSNIGIFLNKSPTPPLEKLSHNHIEFDIDARVIQAFHM
ncbi:helix-turn-helix domain-containing protein [Serratia nematodiphila]|uniref:helix-turn-helix domain-containing protein n=1 Tax=Serratia nematodiphila TaxID=458197 RepID=UPI0011D3C78C|nr:helix-turn-helix domain-containing protein [Serratia nematodiphila]TXE66621.1 winged helix-turn-helix domain-containing protein [Serratia nematodiphila]